MELNQFENGNISSNIQKKKLFIDLETEDKYEAEVADLEVEIADQAEKEEKSAKEKELDRAIGSHRSYASLYRSLAMRAMDMSIFSGDEFKGWDYLINGFSDSMDSHLDIIAELSAQKSSF
ncbi:MAG: hypothetical protein HRT47_12785 [Candidatus Caenarcaniphilales bacterium]|nr:hypothetical protein [Candidatus Caenarcaniphilales bacterium]